MSPHQERDIKRIVHDSLMELMKRAGIDESLHDQVNPITHLGLDSSFGVEFACLLEEKLGIAIDPTINPLVDDKRNHARTLREIVEFVQALSDQEVQHHG